MKKLLILGLMVAMLSAVGLASPAVPEFPRILINARYVYVTSYDGDQYNPNLLPDDRHAISAVQDAIQKWGHYIVVYRPQEADMVVMVQARPSEDLLAVYDAKAWPEQTYLWRVMARSGFQPNETPLITEFRQAVEKMGK
jgi:hypothetical protein